MKELIWLAVTWIVSIVAAYAKGRVDAMDEHWRESLTMQDMLRHLKGGEK